MTPDYYAILNVAPEASEAEIRAAYRRQVRHWHPDLHPGRPEAEARIRALNEAYEVLGNQERRARYHASRGVRVRIRVGAPAAAPARPTPPPRPAARPVARPVASPAPRPTVPPVAACRAYVTTASAMPARPMRRSAEDDWDTLLRLRAERLLRALLGW